MDETNFVSAIADRFYSKSKAVNSFKPWQLDSDIPPAA